ncbi:MAG: hypothetical protein SGJ26_12740 [Nitrospirota bacterium]|nr:hypothetical protein [Nitrospirota bacterium]
MKRGMIELMVLSALFLLSPIANAMETSQSNRPVSGPTDPLLPKPIPPPPTPTPSEPKQPNQILPRA